MTADVSKEAPAVDTSTPRVDTVDLFRGLPRRFQIGSYTFRIKLVGHEHPKLEGNNGMTYCEDAEIYVFNGLQLVRCLEVVQHELTHAINWVYGVTDESTEEAFTTQHSKGLVELGMKNPKWKTWEARLLRLMRKQATKD